MKHRIPSYIALGLVGLTLVLLCAMGVTAKLTGGVGAINAVLKISMYVAFALSFVAFVVAYILDAKRRRDGRK